MTTTDEDQLQPTADGEDTVIDETEAPAEGAEGEEGTEQPDPEANGDEQKEQPKPQENAELKQWRDKANISNGQLATVTRTLKALKDKGLLTDEAIEEAAAAQGVDVSALRSVLNQEPPPANPVQANAQRLVEQFDREKPGELKLAMDEAYGEDTQKYFDAFNWLIGADKDEVQALGDVPANKVVAYAIRRGKEIFAEYEELQAYGGSPLKAHRALKKGAAKPPQPKKERTPMNSSEAPPTPKPRQPGKSFYDGV